MNTTETTFEPAEISTKAIWSVTDSTNATEFLPDLEEYEGLTELETVLLACVATIIPLSLGLVLVICVRTIWNSYKHYNVDGSYDSEGSRREDGCDAVKSSSFMQGAEEMKASESQYSVLMPDDSACCYAADAAPLPPLLYNSPPNNRFGDTNKTNLNGSIITLTMKNNHLIVETEERVPGVCMAESAAAAAAAAGESAAAAAAAASSTATAAGATAAEVAAGADDRPTDYDYEDDDEFDMEAEMLRREFREASLLANGGCGATTAAVLEPSGQTRVDVTADRRPTAATTSAPRQLQPADHSSGGSSSADSRVAEMAYAYGNQSEYTADDNASKHCGKGGGSIAPIKPPAAAANNNEDEYLVEQRMLGNGVDGGGGAIESAMDDCSTDGRVAATAATAAVAAAQ